MSSSAIKQEDDGNDRSNDDDNDSINENKKRPFDKKNHTRRENSSRSNNNNKKKKFKVDFDSNNENDASTEKQPHLGSFANPEMCDKFKQTIQVTHPTVTTTLSSTDVVTTKSADQKQNQQQQQQEKQQQQDEESSRTTSKKKMAIILGFLGTNYTGFQINPLQLTVQSIIEKALYESSLISHSNFGYPHKYAWSSSARTDRGVHACMQVISCKIELPNNNNDNDITKQINIKGEQQQIDQIDTTDIQKQVQSHLPNDIQIIDICRVTRNFCAKTQRDHAQYMYFVPSFLLQDKWHLIFQNANIPLTGRQETAHAPLEPMEIQKIQQIVYSYRSTQEQRDKLQSILQVYQGTHSFHYFTKGLRSDQPQAKRYIIKCQPLPPVIMQDVEWIPIQILGQSFLLHQIRKMMSMAIDVCRGVASIETLQQALKSSKTIHKNKHYKNKHNKKDNKQDDNEHSNNNNNDNNDNNNHGFRIALAPAQGLFLECSYFSGYNRRKPKEMPTLPDTKWDETPKNNNTTAATPYTKWHEFRSTIQDHIAQEEVQQGNFIQYMYQQECIFDYKQFYNLEEKK